MKKKFWVLLVCMLLIIGMLCTACAKGGDTTSTTDTSNTDNDTVENADGAEPVYIAIVNPMSGASSDCGRMTKDGAELFKQVINEAGGIASLGGAPVEIEYYDCTSDATQTKAVMERALATGKYMAVVGNGTSALTLPSLSAVEKAQVPLVTYSNSADLNNQGYKYVFSLSPTAEEIGSANVQFLDYLASLGDEYKKTTAAVVYENSSWGVPVGEATVESCKEMGLEVVYEGTFQNSMTDASALVMNCKNSGADILMMTAYANDSKLIIDTMHSMDYYPLVLGGGSWQSFADSMGEGVLGTLSSPNTMSTISTITDDPKYSGLDEMHRELFGYQFSCQGVMTYACLELICNALEGTPTRDPAELRDAIAAYDGPTIMQPGHVHFDETGVAVEPNAIVCQWQAVDDLVCIWPEESASGSYIDPADFDR